VCRGRETAVRNHGEKGKTLVRGVSMERGELFLAMGVSFGATLMGFNRARLIRRASLD